ncbi:MAG TPA: acyl-CoA dehydrogenase family protein, partial [Myxococcota bacterium]|nr:acyl-CoA dehydrogenase family protein [Myxococcota bacterium]
MELEFGPDYDRFREEVLTFLAETPRDVDRRSFLKAATERGYVYRSIPRRFGGSEQPFDPIRESIVAECFDASPFSWRLGPQSTGMLVPTLLEAGSDWQRERFIPPTLLGDFVWCQGYSEP